jgi:calcium-dependent protein kinase
MNVVHRDLKPENFLISQKGPNGVLKATDFGLSRFFVEGAHLNDLVGSPYYVAPEVLLKKYGKEADIWSCGVILYILLCGWPPFQGDSTQEIFRNIASEPLDLQSDLWDKISDAAKDCVKRMLCRDVNKRMTAAQLLKHPWMKANGVASDETITPEVLTRLRQYGKMNNFKKEALKIVAKALPSQEIIGIREMFKAIDKDGSGCITINELREGLKTKGAELNLTEVESIVNQIDINGNQLIDYEEFIAATIHLNKLNKEELLMEAFKFFDKDESGYITLAELKQALKDTGADIEDAKAVLDAADANSDGEVDYEEFCDMMRNQNFEQLVQAKTALKTHIFIDPATTLEGHAAPPKDLDFDDTYTTKSMHILDRPDISGIDAASPEPVHASKVNAEIYPASP